MPKMEFGKHAGEDISTVPDSYLLWLIKNSQEKIDMCKVELDSRKEKVDNSFMAKIVATGYTTLCDRVTATDRPTLDKAQLLLMKAIHAAGEK